jgi:hypothetical protein
MHAAVDQMQTKTLVSGSLHSLNRAEDSGIAGATRMIHIHGYRMRCNRCVNPG